MKDSNKISVGIDIGGTNTKIGVVTSNGQVINKCELKTTSYETPEMFVTALYNEITQMIKGLTNSCDLIGIGIGAPNGNYFKGTIEFAPNLKWKGIIPLAEMISDSFSLPCFLTNDANAGALGEKIYGAAKDMNDFVFITLGTGLGSGFFVNGKLVYGHDGFAGELGHIIYDPAGRQCGCGRKGCLEQYVSATGIVKTAEEFLQNSNKVSLLRKVNTINAKTITDTANLGDELSLEIFEFTSKILGMKLADTVAITSPEAIFLFGGLSKASSLLFAPTLKYMEENLLNIFKNKVKLLASELNESEAAILGASALVWDNFKF